MKSVSACGYVLIEMLLAIALLSLVFASLFAGLLQSTKIERRIRTEDRIYDPARITKMKMETDLRNAVVLRDYPFRGKENEMSFPLIKYETERGTEEPFLYEIDYRIEDGKLMRRETEITKSLKRKEPWKITLLKGIAGGKFSYSYLDEKEQVRFLSFWLEEPYFGIPSGIKVDWNYEGRSFSRILSVPQGHWGRMVEKNYEAA